MSNVVELDAQQTRELRRVELRDGTDSDEVVFDGDELPTTLHLGVERGGRVIAISTWMLRPYPDLPERRAFQLRGMATERSSRGTGVGTQLLAAGLERCRSDGAEVVWARARVGALDFYLRHGFEVRGHQYVDLTTGLPHRDVVITL